MRDLWQRMIESIREDLAPVLRDLHHPLDEWLNSLPLWVAQACALGLFVITGLWVATLRRDFIFRGAPDDAWWRDLRIWAWLVILPYFGIYFLLGT